MWPMPIKNTKTSTAKRVPQAQCTGSSGGDGWLVPSFVLYWGCVLRYFKHSKSPVHYFTAFYSRILHPFWQKSRVSFFLATFQTHHWHSRIRHHHQRRLATYQAWSPVKQIDIHIGLSRVFGCFLLQLLYSMPSYVDPRPNNKLGLLTSSSAIAEKPRCWLGQFWRKCEYKTFTALDIYVYIGI